MSYLRVAYDQDTGIRSVRECYRQHTYVLPPFGWPSYCNYTGRDTDLDRCLHAAISDAYQGA